MLSISHTLFSIFILRLLSLIFPLFFFFSFPNILISIISANFCDFDIFWLKKISTHHRLVFHLPLFYLVLFIGVSIITYPLTYYYIILLIFIQIFFHLFTDYVTGRTAGIYWFYPLLNKQYSLFAIKPRLGNYHPYIKNKGKMKKHFIFYFQNRLLVVFELFLCLLGIVAFFI
ncbi:metal-dependent hydrolase [Candidatus Woesearchaeota archaeon]|nr:metal-dependent hydrolase [Candidatus Woesearchaeota archaeon]